MAVHEGLVVQMVVERLFKPFWQAKEMIHFPQTNVRIMDARCRGFDSLILGHEGCFAEHRRQEGQAARGQKRTGPPLVLVLLAEIPDEESEAHELPREQGVHMHHMSRLISFEVISV